MRPAAVTLSLLMAACDPAGQVDAHLLDDLEAAFEACGASCVVTGHVRALPASGAHPQAREGLDAAVGLDDAWMPRPVTPAPATPDADPNDLPIGVVQHYAVSSFGRWSADRVDGGFTVDNAPVGLQLDLDDAGRGLGNPFRYVDQGFLVIDDLLVCVGPDSAAQIRRRSACDGGQRNRLLANLEVVGLGLGCDQPATGRLFIRFDEPRAHCEGSGLQSDRLQDGSTDNPGDDAMAYDDWCPHP